MKGFPNQVADLRKLATAMQALLDLENRGLNARDEAVFGEELVRARVAGTGHTPKPIEQYLAEQRRKPRESQSYRATARGLRELFALLRFIIVHDRAITITELGRKAASYAGQPLNPESIEFWRRAIREMIHFGGDTESSHPYQVLLNLIQRRPGITRAKCALALEAKDDSAAELDRIAGLADLTEREIIRSIRVSKPNWDNAKKVLPRFAEQLGDVVRDGASYTLADAPGRADAGTADERQPRAAALRPRAPRSSRRVTPETIARAGAEGFDEVQTPPAADPARAAATIQARLDRLRRHNEIVVNLSREFQAPTTQMFADPFDMLAVIEQTGILAEIKTLDGSAEDQRDRVREALAQLLYYETFVRPPEAPGVNIRKIACFESAITDQHRAWLNSYGIGVMWVGNGRFELDDLASHLVRHYMRRRDVQ